MRRVLIAVMAVAAVLLPATTAWARGDGWQYLPAGPPYDVLCGSGTARLTTLVDREYGRFIDQPDGSTVLQITGSLVLNYRTDAASVTVNAGGPGKLTFYPNGDIEYHAEGLSAFPLSEDQAVELGTPQIFLSRGLIDFIFHPADGSVTPVRIPTNLRDISAELGC